MAVALLLYTECFLNFFSFPAVKSVVNDFWLYFIGLFSFILFVFSHLIVALKFQHVLEHGKPHERSAIIKKLTGQIVQMSQQKFASNVIEKCLSFGTPTERQILVNEMLGSTDENEPLQVCPL